MKALESENALKDVLGHLFRVEMSVMSNSVMSNQSSFLILCVPIVEHFYAMCVCVVFAIAVRAVNFKSDYCY